MLFSIRKKIILFTVVPVTLLYSLIFGVHLYFSIQQANDAVAKRLKAQVWHYANELDTYTKNFIQQARIIADVVESVDTGQAWVTNSLLVKTLGSNSLLRGIGLVLLDKNSRQMKGWQVLRYGQTIKTVEGMETFGPLLMQAWSIEGSEGGRWIESERLEHGKKIISYALPLIRDEQQIGLLKLDICLSDLRVRVIDADMGQPKFTILNSQGYYLHTDSRTAQKYHHQKIFQTLKNYGAPELWHDLPNLISKGEAIARRAWVPKRQHEYWYFGATIKTGPWWLITHIRRDTVLEMVRKEAKVNAAVVLVSLLLIFTCACFVSGRISRPLTQLKQSMDDFTYKKSFPTINKISDDEVGSLAGSFQELLEKLAERDQTLHDMRANNIGHLLQRLKGQYFYFNLDDQGRVTHVSPSIQSILGYKPEVFLGSLERFMVDDASQPLFREQLQAVISGDSAAIEMEVLHQDGRHRRLEIFWSNMFDAPGSYSVIEGVANDITKRINDTRKFKALLDSAADATVISTPEGIISMINSRAEIMFGFSQEELVNMPLRLLTPLNSRSIHPLLGDLGTVSWEQFCLTGFESYAINRDGNIFPVDITGNPLDTDDGLLISMVIRNITDRKKIEQELVDAKQQTDRANRARALFLSNMSHELRTPLNGVLGYTQVLLQDREVKVEHEKSLRSIESSGRHLLSLINDILDLTKIESSQIELHPVALDLYAMLMKVRNRLLEGATAKGIDIQLDYNIQLPLVVIVDEIKLGQILYNLVQNGVKYTHSGSVKMVVNRIGDKLQFAIEDTGIGIDPGSIEKVFEPFRQLKSENMEGGTGLGLAISHRLVTAIGGELTVTSQVNKGSCFRFEIPLVNGDIADIPSRPRSYGDLYCPELPGNWRGEHILVVDDVESNRGMLARLLEIPGFTVYQVNNGYEALDILNDYDFVMILMNIRMPIMDELDILKKIRQRPLARRLKVIAVTASVSQDARAGLLMEGFDACIGKPFDAAELYGLIEKQLGIEFILTLNKKTTSTDVDVLLEKISDQERFDLSRSIRDLIELGDIESIQHVIHQHKGEAEIEELIVYIENLCEAIDLEQLDVLVQKMTKT